MLTDYRTKFWNTEIFAFLYYSVYADNELSKQIYDVISKQIEDNVRLKCSIH